MGKNGNPLHAGEKDSKPAENHKKKLFAKVCGDEYRMGLFLLWFFPTKD